MSGGSVDFLYKLGPQERSFQSVQDTARKASVKNTEEQKLKEACRDFESIFVKMMLDQMKKNVPKDGLLDGGMGRDIFEDMLYDEYAKQISSTDTLGLSKMMFNQLSANLAYRSH